MGPVASAPATTGEPACGDEEAHEACATCGAYSCEDDYELIKHGAVCEHCGELYCGAYRLKGHVECPCGVFTCAEDYDAAAHEQCACGAFACQEKYFAINHAKCEACGLRICNREYTLVSHEAADECGMLKCDPNFVEAEHRKCNGCRELLCMSEADHSVCPACQRYACNEEHEYAKFQHVQNWEGKYDCLVYPVVPELPEEPEVEPAPEPELPPISYITEGDTLKIISNGGNTIPESKLAKKEIAPNVVIGEGITAIADKAFNQTKYVETLQLPDSLEKIGVNAFRAAYITTLNIPEGVTTIAEGAFRDCPNLETITINAKNVYIAAYVARECPELKNVYIYSETVTFGNEYQMHFTNKQDGNASGITFFVANKDIADALFNASTNCHSYGMLIKSIDGTTEYYNTLK